MKNAPAYYPFGRLYLLLAVSLISLTANAQQYDLLIKNAQVIDPKNQINGRMDLAITNGLIAKVAPGIPATEAKKVIDADGLYMVPGLIDIHTHVFVGPQP